MSSKHARRMGFIILTGRAGDEYSKHHNQINTNKGMYLHSNIIM